MRFFVWVSFLWLTTFTLQAQDCTFQLSGKVIDIHDSSALPYAIIKIEGSKKYAEADAKGNYIFKNLCAGNYTFEISHVSCEKRSVKFELTSDKVFNFKLEHHIDELNEVLLTGKLYQNKILSNSIQELNQKQISNLSNLSFGEALAQINGVSTLSTGTSISKPIIQGMHSSRVLIINNNVRMQDQQWGVDHAPNLDINSAANIQVIKGSAALQYGGDAVGGVIVSTPQKAPLTDTIFGSTIANINSNGRGGNLSTSLLKSTKKGWYFKTQASLKRHGDLEAPDYVLSNTGVQENNISFGFGLNKIDSGFNAYYSLFSTEIGILRASHIGNLRDLENSINSLVPSFIDGFNYQINSPKQQVNHHLVKLDYFKKIKNLVKLKAQYAFQFNRRKEFDVRRGERSEKAALDLELTTHQVLTQLEVRQFDRLALDIGVETSFQNNYANPETGVRRLIPDYDMFTLGSFVTSTYNLNKLITIDAGMRYDFTHIDALKFYRVSRWEERGYAIDFADIILEDFGTQLLTNPVFNFHNFSSSLGALFKLGEETEIRSNFSLATRNPNPSELFSDGLHHSIANIELGDLRLKQEQSYKVNLSLSQAFKNLKFEINPYFNAIDNFMVLEPSGIETTIRGAFPVFEYRQTQAQLWGIDAEASYQFNTQTSLQGQIAYIYAEDVSLNQPIINMPPLNTRLELVHNQPNWNNLSLSVSHEFFAKQERFPDLDFSTLILNTETGELEPTLINISESPAAFQLFHVTAEMPFKFNQTDLRVRLQVQNIFNTSYRNYLNRQRYYADEMGRNIQLQIQFNY